MRRRLQVPHDAEALRYINHNGSNLLPLNLSAAQIIASHIMF
jgi:hypothetical protein